MSGRGPCILCKTFFGSADLGGLCSNCYKQFVGSGGAPAGTAGARKIGTVGEAEGKESTLRLELKAGPYTLQVRIGDLTKENVDTIVNAANSYLDHAAGLAGAIVRNGGRQIQDESDTIVRRKGRLETGAVEVTTAGRLPCKKVLHAVGPIWKDGRSGEEMYLQICVRACLDKAEEMKLTSIAMPAISSGIFGFPKDLCAKVMFETVFSYMHERGPASCVREIRFTNFDEQTTALFEAEGKVWQEKLGGVGAGAAAAAGALATGAATAGTAAGATATAPATAGAVSPMRAAGATTVPGFDLMARFTQGEAAGKESVFRTELKTNIGIKIQVRIGDLTKENVDTIVNAANSSLDHAAGLAGAIVRNGGWVIQQESDAYIMSHGRLSVGDVVVTSAGTLPCKKVLHAVGPIWKDGKCGEVLALQVCVRTCLDKAEEMGFASIALPAISSGIFGFPKDLCAKVMFETTVAYIKERRGVSSLREIRFTNFDEQTTKLFEEECTRVDAMLAVDAGGVEQTVPGGAAPSDTVTTSDTAAAAGADAGADADTGSAPGGEGL